MCSAPLLLRWPHPLETGLFLERRKRFLVDVERVPPSDGHPTSSPETVHCANSGSMRSLLVPGGRVWTLDSHNPERKLRHTLELMEHTDGLACVNTQRANALAAALLEETLSAPLATPALLFPGAALLRADLEGVRAVNAECRFDAHTRFDFALHALPPPVARSTPPLGWLEIKSVSLRLAPDTIAFPDSVTLRGQKHLETLVRAARMGQRSLLWFLVMRGSRLAPETLAATFRAAHEIDSRYAELLAHAAGNGVGIRTVIAGISTQGLHVRGYFAFP